MFDVYILQPASPVPCEWGHFLNGRPLSTRMCRKHKALLKKEINLSFVVLSWDTILHSVSQFCLELTEASPV